MSDVHVINGPNLNLLGSREPDLYGHDTLEDVERRCRDAASHVGLDVVFRQSNHEGQLIDWLHEAGTAVADGSAVGVVLNPGAYTHTSVAIRDAIVGARTPVLEVHLTNLHARETFRQHSYVSAVAIGSLTGLRVRGYELAIHWWGGR